MNSLLLTVAITVAVGSLLSCSPTVTQIPPPGKRAARVVITKGPALESARDDFAIIRRTFISLSCNTVQIPRT
jgi:hypothetical protein